MITRITKENANKYNALFKDAIYALQTHDSEGKPIADSGKQPIIPINTVEYVKVDLTADEYEPGYHYIKKEGEWVLTTFAEGFKPEAEYAIAVESGEQITTLEEYFCYIADLHMIDKKFTILPLEDEENFFEIDANTRKITIPEVFAKNGVSVQGDEIAEILYFKIDRYFDMDDLGEKDCYIEWNLPADANGVRKSGVSVPYLMNTEVCPGYVVVGWPIRSELTEIPGSLEFAVRFYTIDEDGTYANRIVYSFSTMPATVEIKSSLNLDLEKINLDGSALTSDDLINSRIENSTPKDDTTPDPDTPEWIYSAFEDLPQEPEKVINDGNDLYTTYNVFLTDKETGEETDGIFVVQAKIDDSGRLSYNWIKRDESGEIVMDYDGGDSSTFIEVLDYNSQQDNVVYYQEADELGNHAEFVWDEDIPNLATAGRLGVKVYVRVAKIVMNCDNSNYSVLGSYQARAINRLSRKTARAFSDIARIDGPTAPVISSNLGTSATFNAQSPTVNLNIDAETDPHAYVSYQLYHSAEKDGDYAPVGVPKTSNQFTIEGKEYSKDNPSADLNDGYYYVNVSAKLNSVVESVNSEPIRVTHEASPVSITNSEPTYQIGSIVGYDINKPISVEVSVHPSEEGKRTDEDSLTYQWFKYQKPNDTQFAIDVDLAQKGEYQVSNIDSLIKGATSAEVQIENTAANEQGYYFCRVINTYNGTTNIKCSDFFNIID